MSDSFSHLNERGEPAMVDVSGKRPTYRQAQVRSIVMFPEVVMERLQEDKAQTIKGHVFQTAITDGNMAVK